MKNEIEIKFDEETKVKLDETTKHMIKSNKITELSNLLFTVFIILIVVQISMQVSNANKLQEIAKEKTMWYKKVYKELTRLELVENEE